MSDKTDIAWTESTWNPVTGCTKVSAGCKNCYAERDWARLAANPKAADYFGRPFTDVKTHPHRMDQPLRWRRPRRIFVNSMSDLFHESVPDAVIDEVFAVMLLAPHHTFQVLTKRPGRMVAYFQAKDLYQRVLAAANGMRKAHPKAGLDNIPIDNPASRFAPHIWWGVSVEDQESALARIPLLLSIPVAVHWVSAEPLLGPLDLTPWLHSDHDIGARILADIRAHTNREAVSLEAPLHLFTDEGTPSVVSGTSGGTQRAPFAKIDWVVVGGESGPRVRVFCADWARTLIKDCRAANVPVFIKQMGAFWSKRHTRFNDGSFPVRPTHRAGADPQEWPADLQVREYPDKQALSHTNGPADYARAIIAR